MYEVFPTQHGGAYQQGIHTFQAAEGIRSERSH